MMEISGGRNYGKRLGNEMRALNCVMAHLNLVAFHQVLWRVT